MPACVSVGSSNQETGKPAMSRIPAWLQHVAMAVLLIYAAAGSAKAQDPVRFSALSHGVYEDRLRLIFSTTPLPVFASFQLSDPDRLVIDVPSMVWEVDHEDTQDIPYIGAIRHGLFRRDRARIVLDLTEPVGVQRIFTRPPAGSEPGRLIIDLSPVSRAAFDERAGWPEKARWAGRLPGAASRAPGDIVVAIDPGHGGIDPGATFGKLTEKDVVLDFAVQLAREIDSRDGYQAYLVRTQDVFVPLHQRVARAHAAGAHLMLSLHADTLLKGNASGMSAYTLSEKGTDDAAIALAARENRSDVLAGADLEGESDDLTQLLVELAQRGTQVESLKLAEALVRALDEGEIELLRTRPLRQANFRVLKAPDIPSVLLEIGFMDSARDRKRLVDKEWRSRVAVQITDGIADWRREASPGFLSGH